VYLAWLQNGNSSVRVDGSQADLKHSADQEGSKVAHVPVVVKNGESAVPVGF
jgi:hypothetical protein